MNHHTPTFNESISFYLPGAAGAKFEPVARSTYMATRVEALKSSNIRLILEETEELIPELLRVYGMHCMIHGIAWDV